MRILVTGSTGHLGEGLVRTLQSRGYEVTGLDVLESPYTALIGSIVDRAFVRRCVQGMDAVLHAAALHKPHVVTHGRDAFIDTNIRGTLNLLEEAHAAGVNSFVFTSTTSVFGDALVPPDGAPATWITEDVPPVPKNIYGATKAAAEDLCQLFHRNLGLPCLVLRTSRFFPEEDDSKIIRDNYANGNAKANEQLFRRADLEDVVEAHLLAMERAPEIGFGRYIISATTPFRQADLRRLRHDAPDVVRELFPDYEGVYRVLGWRMFQGIDRVYVNDRARDALRWTPRHDFRRMLERLRAGEEPRSCLAVAVGTKLYHATKFADGPYPVE